MELADKQEKDSFDLVYGSNAGWFSDNNFVAEGGRTYTIEYSSFKFDIDAEDFASRLSTRVLQNIYSDADYKSYASVEELLTL